MKQNRTKALLWWDKLSYSTKFTLWTRYKLNNFTPSTSEAQLTGREIELIYIKEMEKAYYPEGLE